MTMFNCEPPEVAGRVLDDTLAMFEWRCRVAIGREQEKLSPDNALIALLADAVRVGREYQDAVKRPFRSPNTPLEGRVK